MTTENTEGRRSKTPREWMESAAFAGLHLDGDDEREVLVDLFAAAMSQAAREERHLALTEAIHAMEEPQVTDWVECVRRVDHLRKNPLRAVGAR